LKSIYCLRHGQTNYNVLGLCNDDPSRDVHLTELGRGQAQEAANALRHARLQKIFVSPLRRTRETAEIINQFHHAPIMADPLLIDIRSGFDSLPVTDYFATIARNRLHARPPNGESVFEHKQRVLAFIRWLMLQGDASVLVVAHEETMRVFIAYFADLSDEEMLDVTARNCQIFHWER
jgi:probable phosphoglycerate mutase